MCVCVIGRSLKNISGTVKILISNSPKGYKGSTEHARMLSLHIHVHHKRRTSMAVFI
jgi:hypothetical protein